MTTVIHTKAFKRLFHLSKSIDERYNSFSNAIYFVFTKNGLFMLIANNSRQIVFQNDNHEYPQSLHNQVFRVFRNTFDSERESMKISNLKMITLNEVNVDEQKQIQLHFDKKKGDNQTFVCQKFDYDTKYTKSPPLILIDILNELKMCKYRTENLKDFLNNKFLTKKEEWQNTNKKILKLFKYTDMDSNVNIYQKESGILDCFKTPVYEKGEIIYEDVTSPVLIEEREYSFDLSYYSYNYMLMPFYE